MSHIWNFIRGAIHALLRVLTRIFLLDVILDPTARPVLVWAGTLVVFGTLAFSRLEGWSYLDAFYFSVVTLATVGYGDFTPKTDAGKVLVVFFILNGLGVLLALLNTITEIRRKKVLQPEGRRWQPVQKEPKAVETAVKDEMAK